MSKYVIPVVLTTDIKSNWQSTCQFTEHSSITSDFNELLNCRNEISLDTASLILGVCIFLLKFKKSVIEQCISTVFLSISLIAGAVFPLLMIFLEDYSPFVTHFGLLSILAVTSFGWLFAFSVKKSFRKAVPFILKYWGCR
jgi:VIT1/CCC1 family predicted Fe2+/Mn2+ transporter